MVGQFRLEGSSPQEIVVTLQPGVRVRGRLIESETGLPAERYGLFCENSTLGDYRIESPPTNDAGRFEIRGLLPGIVYEMNGFNEQRFTSNRNRFKINLTNAEPGDVVDLGDVTGK